MSGGYLWKKRKQRLAMLLVLVIFSVGVWQHGIYARADNVRADDIPFPEDTVTPSFSAISIKNNNGFAATDTDGSYYFQDDLSVRFSIEEEEPPEGEVQTPVRIRKNGSVILETEEEYGTYDFADTIRESGKYIYTIEDTAGNTNDMEIVVTAVQSFSEPDMELVCENGAASEDGMYYLNDDPELMINISDEIGIAEIAYRTGNDKYEVLRDYADGDSYAAGENLSFEGAAGMLNETLSELLQQMEEGAYRYTFRVTNVLGNTVEKEVKFMLDRTGPDPMVFVSYETDGTNQETAPDSHTGFMDFLNGAMDRLFGKSEIVFHLYMRDGRIAGQNPDEVSGIDTEDIFQQIVSKEGNASVRELEVMDENTSFACNGEEYEGYTHIRGSFTFLSENVHGTSDRIMITRIKDRAGNVLEKINAEDISGSVLLYLDREAPVLKVDYKNGRMDGTEGQNRFFYTEDAEVKLELKETGYHIQTDAEGNPVPPTVTVMKNGEADPHVRTEGWTVPSDGETEDSGVHSGLCFPASEKEEESEYEFMVKYQDASGNFLTMEEDCMGKVSDGVFTSCRIIVDNRAPKLTAFSIEGETDRQCGGINVYQNQEGSDVCITFTVDDHAAYWNPAAVKAAVYSQTTKEAVLEVDGTALAWSDEGREHKGYLPFDGAGNMDADSFYAVVSYKDRAGNLLINSGVEEGRMDAETGNYTSPVFILDHKAPVFDITYSAAHRLVQDDDSAPANDLMGKEPLEGYTAYYGKNIAVEFSIEESSAVPIHEGEKCKGMMDFELLVKGVSGKLYKPQINWSEQGIFYKGTFVLTEEDTYTIAAKYHDAAGNEIEGGSYRSMNLVLDRTAPVIRISYTDTAFREMEAENVFPGDGRLYFSRPVYLKLTVEDQNVRYYELKKQLSEMKQYEQGGKAVGNSNAGHFLDQVADERIEHGRVTWYIPLTTEANYDLFLSCEDLSGNRSVGLTETLCADYGEPELELSYKVMNSGFLDAVRYGDISYLFAGEKLEIHASAKDFIAGIQYIRYTVTDEDGKEREQITYFEPTAKASDSVVIPLEHKDFKGLVRAEACDWSGNRAEKKKGHMIESREKHENSGSAVITTYTSPGRTVGGEDYYNTDIHFNLTLKDEYSGLRKISYSGGNTLSGSRDYAEEAENALAEEMENSMVFTYSEDMVLKAADNNENDLLVRAELMDNTGHTSSVEQLYHIDITAPAVTVEYDQNEPANGRFYSCARTALVTIRERNFDEQDVNFQITSSEGVMPVIGEWNTYGTGDDMKHVCRIVFEEDGDYTFTVSFEDKAGNRAEYGRVDEFTIDRTAPVLAVTYDNEQCENDFYYAKKRTAAIDILEHNFDPACIEVVVTKDDGEFPLASEWSKDGDHNRLFISFDEDAGYTIAIRGMDQAGNSMEEYGTDFFVIDQTAPFLEIFGTKDRSANQGMVMPGVRWSDTNGDPDRVKILLKGYRRGIQTTEENWKQTEQGMEFQMEDFPHDPESDDLYTLEAVVHDLAGNQSKAQVIFSVNRFGSVYTFDEKTASLAGEQGAYYTNQEQDIVVTETNVDTLEFHEIICNRNGELRTLTEGEDYEIDMSETENGWKQYIYTVDKKNFRDEGTYTLTIYSEDRAQNQSDNQTKGKEIAFVVDKTAPDILISGIKDGGQYREKHREAALDVQDNVCVKEVGVFLNGEKQTYSASDLAGQGGRLKLMVGDSGNWQTLRVQAVDMAGNEQQLEELRFLITSNPFVQLFRNKIFLSGFTGMFGISAVAAGLLKKRRKRRREVES